MRLVNGKSTFGLAAVLLSAFIIGLVFLSAKQNPASMHDREASHWIAGRFDADENEENPRRDEGGFNDSVTPSRRSRRKEARHFAGCFKSRHPEPRAPNNFRLRGLLRRIELYTRLSSLERFGINL